MPNVATGKHGEELAKKFLSKHGYDILEEHWQKRTGEIDIIAMDNGTKELVFVEVKTRTSTKFGWPEEKVTRKKRENIRKTAQLYLLENGHETDGEWRVDVISIIINKTRNKAEITHFKGIQAG